MLFNQCFAVQSCHKITVFGILKFRLIILFASLVFLKLLEGFNHHTHDKLTLVVPKDIMFFELLIKRFVLSNDLFHNFYDKLLLRSIVAAVIVHISFVQGRFKYPVKEATNKFGMI